MISLLNTQPENNNLPSVNDFSKASIKKALGSYALNHWVTKYSGSTLFLTILAAVLFGVGNTILIVGGSTLILTGGSWIYNRFIQAENFSFIYVERLHQQLLQQTELKREVLKRKLTEHKSERGALQLSKIREKFDSLIELLSERLSSGELTFKRYLGIAQEVQLSAIDNLTAIVAILMSISEIDEVYIQNRINELKLQKNDARAKEEIETLQDRLTLKQEQLDKVEDLFLENERAMTQLDKTATAIAAMDTGQFQAGVDMENSMNDLIEITERSTEYSSS